MTVFLFYLPDLIFFRKLPWSQKLNGYLCRYSSTPLIARVPLGGFVMLQSLRNLVHVYMQASSWNSVKVVMDADPRGSASGEMPVANSVPIIVTDFDPFGGTRRGLEGPSQGSRLPFFQSSRDSSESD